MTWTTVEINGDVALTHPEAFREGNSRSEPASEYYADMFEKVVVRNDTGEDVMCKHCGTTISREDVDTYEDDECRDNSAEDGGHEWSDPQYAWFDEARVSVGDGPGEESITATITAKGKRFRVTVYLGEDGRLRVTQNGTSGTAGATEHAAQTYTEMIIAD